jgi:hypothetical protein
MERFWPIMSDVTVKNKTDKFCLLIDGYEYNINGD